MCHFHPVHHLGMAFLAGSKAKIQHICNLFQSLLRMLSWSPVRKMCLSFNFRPSFVTKLPSVHLQVRPFNVIHVKPKTCVSKLSFLQDPFFHLQLFSFYVIHSMPKPRALNLSFLQLSVHLQLLPVDVIYAKWTHCPSNLSFLPFPSFHRHLLPVCISHAKPRTHLVYLSFNFRPSICNFFPSALSMRSFRFFFGLMMFSNFALDHGHLAESSRMDAAHLVFSLRVGITIPLRLQFVRYRKRY